MVDLLYTSANIAFVIWTFAFVMAENASKIYFFILVFLSLWAMLYSAFLDMRIEKANSELLNAVAKYIISTKKRSK